MKFETYEIIANGKTAHFTVDAVSHEMAYRNVGNWWMPSTPVTIRNTRTGECQTFTCKLDNAGNLVSVIRH